MAVAIPPTPPGMIPPLTVDNDENHSGLITIIVSFAMFLVLGSLGIRVYSAYTRRARGSDDIFFTFIVIIALVQISAVFVSVHLGWGQAAKLILPNNGLKKALYSADILYVAILGLSKGSTAAFYRTITMRNSQWMIHGLLGVIMLWGPVAMCGCDPWNDINDDCPSFVSFRVRAKYSYRDNADSGGQFSRWQTITAFDIILEVALFLYPMRVIPKLHTSLDKKVVVVLILSCRAILIPVAAMHLHYIHVQAESSSPTLDGTVATLVAEIHVALSIVVLIAPLMKPFIAAYVDENGLAYTDDVSKSRSPPSSRTRTIKAMLSSKTRDPYLWAEDNSSRLGTLGPENQIMKSVQISVDRQKLELPERCACSSQNEDSGVPLVIH
ncbi:hypothetical protein N7454_003952 [Penicillium verhagenii]|nr:hypothetical protein N7454_003952 [Penicillium verhagenii]